MKTTHLLAMGGLYCTALVAVAYLTRAKMLRIAGALAGAAVFGVVAMPAIGLGQNYGWWRVPQSGSVHFRLLLWLSLAFSCAPVYLITWRVARRFGGLGLTGFTLAAAVIGPVRDYQVAKIFPSWIAFSPGIAPILAIALIYSALIVVGHAVMRTVSGPARNDLFAQRHIGAVRNNSH